MKRFVTYLYQYDNNTKMKNTGFAKVEVRGGICQMEIIVRGATTEQDVLRVALFMEDDHCLDMGRINILQGSGSCVLTFDEENIDNTGYTFANITGIAMKGEHVYIASCWVDEPSVSLTAGKWEELDRKEEPEATVDTDSTISYRHIDLTDIRKMPKKNWYLCNNNFLVHGFFSYHYLVEKRVATEEGERVFVGVPGVYEKPERMMASLFGFHEFEPVEQENMGKEIKVAQSNEDYAFGYYFCEVEGGSMA